jgi:hypothetical protein
MDSDVAGRDPTAPVSNGEEISRKTYRLRAQINTRSKSTAIRLFGNAFAASAKISTSG